MARRKKTLTQPSRRQFNRKLEKSDRLDFQILEPRQLLASIVYDDAFQGSWQDWSWGTTVDTQNTSPVRSGSHSIAATHNEAWSGFYIGSNDAISIDPINEELKFSIHGGSTGGQQLEFYLVDGAFNTISAGNYTLAPNQWNDIIINFDDAGSPYELTGFMWQEFLGSPQPAYYIDAVEVGDFEADEPPEPGDGPVITIDPSTQLREISDGVYGLNFADEAFADEIDLAIDRWGGNSTTRYNYQIDATNLASDYYFENYPSSTGGHSDDFIQKDINVGADSILTIGTIGWTPNSDEIRGSYSVAKYGAQQDVDPWRPDNGNGVRLDGSLITDNDPSDTSVEIDEQFAIDWVTHNVNQFGDAANGGVRYYALDNEPMLWNSTHRDVHSEPASYDEVLAKGIQYAAAIKQADPTAEILGPVVWGWTAYFYSALDAAGEGAWWEDPQDRNAHGGQAFVPWYLQEMSNYEQNTGTRLLDYLDIHYYPQNPGVALSSAGSIATQDIRLESTRSLWDSTYVDQSWIAEEVNLIPRMRNWIDNYYPDTKLAITEYNWGGVEHINGAVAQADVLGILGREGVDIATMWAAPDPSEPGAYAFRMFRNYDGAQTEGSKFGETSLQATTEDVDLVSVFAAQRDSDDALTIILVNKSRDALETPVNLAGIGTTSAEVYTYSANDLNNIIRGDDLGIENGSAELVLPGYSITLLEVPLEIDLLTVTNANDAGVGSLREAILAANSMTGVQTIQFDIATDQDRVVNLQTALPAITDQLILSALSSSSVGPTITLDGSQLPQNSDGLKILAGGTDISGLSIVNFDGDGIEIREANNVLLSDNVIGVQVDGNNAGNGGERERV